MNKTRIAPGDIEMWCAMFNRAEMPFANHYNCKSPSSTPSPRLKTFANPCHDSSELKTKEGLAKLGDFENYGTKFP